MDLAEAPHVSTFAHRCPHVNVLWPQVKCEVVRFITAFAYFQANKDQIALPEVRSLGWKWRSRLGDKQLGWHSFNCIVGGRSGGRMLECTV